jgi:hypothetical protein
MVEQPHTAIVILLVAKPLRNSTQRLNEIENDFGTRHQGNSQDQSQSTPYPPPKKQREGHGEGIQSEPATDQLWIQKVHAKNMENNDRRKHNEQVTFGKDSHPSCDWDEECKE